MKIKGFFQDIGGASRVTKMRQELIRNGSPVPQPKDPIRELADALHPGRQTFTITQIRDASPTAKTYRFEPENGHVPVFQAGQYVSIYFTIGTSVLTRAYSISSAPFEARLEKPFFEITVRNGAGSFVPDWMFANVTEGTKLDAALPFGQFYYEPLRDSRNVVALAGGSGITPFVSMAKEIAAGKLDIDLTILYGSLRHTDIVCEAELEQAKDQAAALAAQDPDFHGSIKTVYVMSDDPEWTGETGFITREIIEKYSAGDVTYLFCGPQAMSAFIGKVMAEMGVGPRRYRHDVTSQPAKVDLIPGFPAELKGKQFKITVVRGIQEDVIDAAADEPVAVALERAAIPVDTHCRGGECGFCRSQLLAGDIFVSPLGDGRRREDKEMGWFHACSAYPMSDLKIKIPIL